MTPYRVVAYLLLAVIGMSISFGCPSTGELAIVPNVVGETQAAAEATLAAADLTLGAVTERFDATVPSGIVISQDPAAGASVPAESAVDLLVSKGPGQVRVPNVVGQPQSAAEAALDAAGLHVQTLTEAFSTTVTDGHVISQDPGANAEVAAGSGVDLVISKGPAPATVPNLVGQTQAAAKAALEAAGLVLGAVTEQFSDTVPAGTVISQSPAGGASVTQGASADLVVSKGPDVSTVPDLIGQTRAAAGAAIAAARLAVGIVSEQFDATVAAGLVLSQNPIAGATVVPGSTVDFVVSKGPVLEGPTAAFTANFVMGEAPLIVQFEDQSSTGTSPIDSWEWSFGDPASGTANVAIEQNPSHVYNDPGTYAVTLTVTTADGTDNATLGIQVTPGAGEELSPEVRVVDDIPTLRLDTASGQEYRFLYTGNGAPPVQPGDILAGTEGEGFLRRVTAVKSIHTKVDGSKSVAIETAFCSLTEAVENGSLQFDEPIKFTPEDFQKAGLPMTADNKALLDGISLSSSFEAGLKGSVDLSRSIDFDLDIRDWKVDYFRMAADGALDIDFGAYVASQASLSYDFEKSIFPGAPPTRVAVAFIGPVPVVLVTQFDIIAGIDAETQGRVSLDTGFASNTSIALGAEYDGEDWTRIDDLSLGATRYGPEWTIDADAEVTLYLKPVISSRIAGVAGPTVAAKAYFTFDYQQLPEPATAQLRAGINADAAFDLVNLEIIGRDFKVGFRSRWAGPSYVLYEWRAGCTQSETFMLPGGVPLEMVCIPAGSFLMGRYPGEQDSLYSEDPQHLVTISSNFQMGKFEVTKRQWEAVMGTTPWSGASWVRYHPDSPAQWVSPTDARDFIDGLNDYTGKAFRLPTEAEWEYACRAGTTTRFYWGDDPAYSVLNAFAYVGWYSWTANGLVVGQKLPNAFGLYDMSGNVWEFCEDDWHSNYLGAPVDGSAWVDSPRGSHRVLRGGSFHSWMGLTRSAARPGVYPNYNDSVGFRLAR